MQSSTKFYVFQYRQDNSLPLLLQKLKGSGIEQTQQNQDRNTSKATLGRLH